MSYKHYSCQTIEQDDIDAVVETLKGDFLTQGPKVQEFEEALCHYTGAAHAIVVSSGTAALHLAAKACGITKDSLVWTSPITFVASANCAKYLGAQVDFIDVDPHSGNISIQELRKKLKQAKKKPDLIIPVHLAGHSCDMKEIAALAQQYSFKVIEDAAHALGGSQQDAHKTGASQHSDATIVSFHPVKSLTTAEGGAILTNQKTIAQQAFQSRTHSITKQSEQFQNQALGPCYYEQQDLGYHYRLSDMQAALGCSQIKKLDRFIKQRVAIAQRYTTELSTTPLRLPHFDQCSAWHLYIIQCQDKAEREKLYQHLRAAKIGCNVHYYPVHLQPYYQSLGSKSQDFPNAESFANKILSIPIHPKLSQEDQSFIIDSINQFYNV